MGPANRARICPAQCRPIGRRITGTRSFSPSGGWVLDNSWTSHEIVFSFEGRINRAKYWYALYAGMISCLVRLVVLALVLGAIFGASVKSVHLNIYDIFNDPPSFPFRVSFGSSGPASLASLLFDAGGTPIIVVAIRFLAASTVR